MLIARPAPPRERTKAERFGRVGTVTITEERRTCLVDWIVVGVDGSENSRQALRWALDEARLRQAQVRVVHAWWM